MTAQTVSLDSSTENMMFGSTELGPLTEIPTEGPARSSVERILRTAWRIGIGAVAGLVLLLAWLVASSGLYKAGDDIGYNLGLVGGLMMLSLLFYPLRKRARFMDRLGPMRYWFRYHMVAGIAGPSLVIFHSTFQIDSMNSRVALYAMLLVAISGIVGRFLYRHIHKGMDGQHLTMQDAENDLRACTEDVRTVFSDYPQIEDRLKAFRSYAFADVSGLSGRFWRFATLKFKGHRLSRSVREQLQQAMKKAKADKRLTRNLRIITYRLAREKADAYVDAVCEASQLSSWERMFSLWHVVHVPFLYLLLISGIVHVVAVHMY